jgi:hypothetical protein
MDVTKRHISHRPHFQGAEATRKVRAERMQTEEALLATVRQDVDPIIGNVPPHLLETTGLSERQFVRILDKAARRILRLNLEYQPHTMNDTSYRDRNRRRFGRQVLYPKLLSRFRKNDTPPVELFYFNSGCVGHLFTLKIGDDRLIFKVSDHIAGNIANEAYFTALGTCDIPQFYVGNPVRKWALIERLDEDMPLAGRPGKRLAEHGYYVVDNPIGNRVGPYTVDLEKVRPLSERSPLFRD